MDFDEKEKIVYDKNSLIFFFIKAILTDKNMWKKIIVYSNEEKYIEHFNYLVFHNIFII